MRTPPDDLDPGTLTQELADGWDIAVDRIDYAAGGRRQPPLDGDRRRRPRVRSPPSTTSARRRGWATSPTRRSPVCARRSTPRPRWPAAGLIRGRAAAVPGGGDSAADRRPLRPRGLPVRGRARRPVRRPAERTGRGRDADRRSRGRPRRRRGTRTSPACHSQGGSHIERALRDGGAWQGGPYSVRAQRAFDARRDDVIELLGLAERLAAAVRARGRADVITHGEPHPANILTTPGGKVLLAGTRSPLRRPSATCGRWRERPRTPPLSPTPRRPDERWTRTLSTSSG